jgi:hypothetical protein
VGVDISRDISRLFDTAQEANITSWFSSVELMIAGALLLIIARVKTHSADPFARHWNILAWIFFFLSMEEIAGFHEKLIEPLRNATGSGGIFYFAWVLVVIPLVLIFVLFYLRFLTNLPRKTAYQFLVAGAVFVLGAVGFEMLGGMYHGVFGVYRSLTAIEETLENLGAGLFIVSLLMYIKSNLRSSLPVSAELKDSTKTDPESEQIMLEFMG